MSPHEVRELAATTSSLQRRENFIPGTFVLDAGFVINSLENLGHTSHLTTELPTFAQAQALAEDIKMVGLAHDMPLTEIVNYSTNGLHKDAISKLAQIAAGARKVDAVIICGINQAIERSNKAGEAISALLSGSSGPAVIGLTVGMNSSKTTTEMLNQAFDHSRAFEARINPYTALSILTEYLPLQQAKNRVVSLNNERRLTWPNILKIANKELAKSNAEVTQAVAA